MTAYAPTHFRLLLFIDCYILGFFTNKLNKNKMEKLLKELNKKFDKYHKKQMKINNNQDPDYYLYMGKANAIGEVIDLIEKNLKDN